MHVSSFLRFALPAGIALGFFVTASHTFAVAGPDCAFDAKIADLATFKKDGSRYIPENIRRELALRKDILSMTLDCSIADVEQLRVGIAELSNDPPGVSDMKKFYLDQLDYALHYYAEAKTRIDTLGLSGSAELARSLKTWRASNYAPVAEQALHLIMWGKNQSLFATARARFGDINKGVRGLDLVEHDDVRTALEKSESDLLEAEQLNIKAKNLLANIDSSTETITMIKQSLEVLAETYADFFDVSVATRKLLPK